MDAAQPTPTEKPMNYSRLAQAMHWISMLLILGLWGMGAYMTNFAPDTPLRATMYRSHMLFGNIVLILTIVRVAMIFFEKRPALPEGITGFKRVLFEGNHYARCT